MTYLLYYECYYDMFQDCLLTDLPNYNKPLKTC